MRLFVLLVTAVSLVGCPNVPPPKQREDWSVPPTKYGTTEFQGLAAPDRTLAKDAGAAPSEPSTDPSPP